MARDPEKPYIGVTGITQVKEAKTIAQAFITEGLTSHDSTHKGMVGLLASQRTLSSRATSGERYPNIPLVREIFTVTQGITFNTLHYTTSTPDDLSRQTDLLIGRTGLYADRLCDGIQLNLAWPPPQEIARIRDSFPNLKVILQLGPRVLSEKTPEAIAEGLSAYEELIDYALIDPSGGRGMIFETNRVTPIHNQIRDAFPSLPVVFAGGFDAKNIRTRLWLLFQAVGSSNFGVDAEQGIRIQKQGQPETTISLTKTTRYIHHATIFFKNQPQDSSNLLLD